VLASIACDAPRASSVSMGVKSEKTFEEIVERLAALFRLKPRPGDRDDEERVEIGSAVEIGPAPEQPPVAQKPSRLPKDQVKQK
jgi:hypothetical protein